LWSYQHHLFIMRTRLVLYITGVLELDLACSQQGGAFNSS
jgi:hypothetical protein